MRCSALPIGLGALSHIYEKAFRCTFGLPVSTAIAGMERLEHLEETLHVAEHYHSFSYEEHLELFKEVLPLVTPKAMPWKAEH